MKNNFTLFLLLLLSYSSVNAFSSSPDSLQRITSGINTSDTVVFDIAQASVNGGYVEFPLYFISDDTINALDFSFKYNQLNFTYDSIIDVTNYIQGLAYYNPNDSIVRFTSYSLQSYTNDTILVKIRFAILSSQFCSADMNTIKVYLNGDPCTSEIITCIPSGLDNDENNFIQMYPNPAGNVIHVQSIYKSELEILTLDGRKMMDGIILKSGEEQAIDLKNLSIGVYLVRLISDKGIIVKKIVVDSNKGI